MTGIDYRKFYNLDKYLSDEVGPSFRSTGQLEPIEFMAILIWKANRAKHKHVERLKIKAGSFRNAVEQIARGLFKISDSKDQLRFLMKAWEFRLPTATAILSVLYPEKFTVYDVRVCNQLNRFHELAWRKFSGRLWTEYHQFVDAVKARTPLIESLREKDRFLWGESWHADAERDMNR